MEPLWSMERTVFVRHYVRLRFGRQEDVRQHWRSLPHQLPLFP